jgi:hypothetical protein
MVPSQQHTSSVLLYLTNHSQHVSSIGLKGTGNGSAPLVTFHELPYSPQELNSLAVKGLRLQLQPGDGSKGVLGLGAALKQLQVDGCMLLDGVEGLTAALTLLPGLEHLSIVDNSNSGGLDVPSDVLRGLPHLRFLEVTWCELEDPDSLQHLQAMTGLQDLRLGIVSGYIESLSSYCVKVSMLSGLKHLTRLQLFHALGRAMLLEPGALTGHTQLQHLTVSGCSYFQEGEAEAGELLSHLQKMQQLTYLDLGSEGASHQEPSVPVAAYSALTASSKLQHLDISCCMLPADAWQHIFPAGRQLPHLQTLIINQVRHPSGAAVAPEVSRLISCCPGLQTLLMAYMQYSSELLAPLVGLSSLSELSLRPADDSPEFGQGMEVVSQLTWLRRLKLSGCSKREGLMLSLTQLQQLTYLELQEPNTTAMVLQNHVSFTGFGGGPEAL